MLIYHRWADFTRFECRKHCLMGARKNNPRVNRSGWLNKLAKWWGTRPVGVRGSLIETIGGCTVGILTVLVTLYIALDIANPPTNPPVIIVTHTSVPTSTPQPNTSPPAPVRATRTPYPTRNTTLSDIEVTLTARIELGTPKLVPTLTLTSTEPPATSTSAAMPTTTATSTPTCTCTQPYTIIIGLTETKKASINTATVVPGAQ